MSDEKKIIAVITVTHRDGFAGYGSAGTYWSTGETLAEVTRQQFDAIRSDETAGHPIAIVEQSSEAATSSTTEE